MELKHCPFCGGTDIRLSMYDELVNDLRDFAVELRKAENALLVRDAADAIVELCGLCPSQSKDCSEDVAKYLELWGKQPRWIPVTERLPESGRYVLAYEDGDIMMASYAGGNWVLRDIFEVIDDLKPTHWMPLPEPPKED